MIGLLIYLSDYYLPPSPSELTEHINTCNAALGTAREAVQNLNATINSSMNTAEECVSVWSEAANAMAIASNEMLNQAGVVSESTSALAESSSSVVTVLHGMIDRSEAAGIGLGILLQNVDKISSIPN